MLPTTVSQECKDSLEIKSFPPHPVTLRGAGSVTEERELQLPAQLSHPRLPMVTARGQSCLGGFPGAQLRAVVWKSSDVLLLNRPSKHHGNWLQLSGAAHAETC